MSYQVTMTDVEARPTAVACDDHVAGVPDAVAGTE
jgi:hypothetical protein